MGFVVKNVALGKVFRQVLQFSPVSNTPHSSSSQYYAREKEKRVRTENFQRNAVAIRVHSDGFHIIHLPKALSITTRDRGQSDRFK